MNKLTAVEKAGYGLGDTASNIVFQVVVNFMIYFYTDVFGIAAGAAGTLMLVVRLFDGITDPIMGAIADRTKTRWGRYRPWLLWMSVPYGIMAVVAFITPDFSTTGKLIYAYVTYAVLMTIYTAINIPYSALGGVITTDPQERASVQSWRFGLAMVGGAIVAAVTLPLVELLGQGNDQLGFTLAMVVLGTFAVLCFVGCFLLTRERAEEEHKKPDTNVREDVAAMLSNKQWWIVAIVTFLSLIGVVMRGGATPYYVEYYLNEKSMISAFMTGGMIAGVFGAMVAGAAVKKVCKVTVMKIAIAGIILFHFILFFVPRDAVYVSLIVSCFANFFHMMFIPMVFSAVPDTVDYSQAKSGRGGMGMSYSGHLLALKFGIALGGAMVGWMLSGHGYVAGQEQTELALSGLVRIYAGASVVAGAFMLIVIQFYKLKKGWETTLQV